MYEAWKAGVEDIEKQYSEGYVLVVDQLGNTVLKIENQWNRIQSSLYGAEEETMLMLNQMTPNKKGIVQLQHATTTCHAITVAREDGIFYAGFLSSRDELLPKINNGDIMKGYFKDGKWHLFVEGIAQEEIEMSHPLILE
ncbi:MAG: hypothetical protein V3V00_08700 [Saprospiraceae bacterium]